MEEEHNTQPKASGEILKHLDLFSGIGGFSLAAQCVWQDEHEIVAFCEIDKFCQKVLRKNFRDIPIYDDIKKFRITAYADNGGQFGEIRETLPERERTTVPDTEFSGGNIRRTSVYRQGETERIIDLTGVDLLTGGFPCQPFSFAGKRKGNEDDRALWPEMLRIIQEVKPRWIIGENVAGFVNMALDQSITDLENEGYEVQTFIIPACAVNAPHRRDRCWIVANDNNARNGTSRSGINRNELAKVEGRTKFSQFKLTGQVKIDANTGCKYGQQGRDGRVGSSETLGSSCEPNIERCGKDARNPQSGSDRIDQTQHEGREDNTGRFEQVDSNAKITGLTGGTYGQGQGKHGRTSAGLSWDETEWYEVATRFCRVDDGVSNRVDRLKSLGNAIVPQVVYEIMKCIKEIDDTPTTLP